MTVDATYWRHLAGGAGRLEHLGSQLLIAALAMLLCSALLLGLNVSDLQRSAAWVREADSELVGIADVDRAVRGAAMAVDGYNLTGDAVFHDRFRNQLGKLDAALGALAEDFADDPQEIRMSYTRLRGDIGIFVKNLKARLYLGPAEKAMAAGIALDPQTFGLPARLWAGTDKLRLLEAEEIREHGETAAHQADRSYGRAVAIGGVAYLLGGLGLLCMGLGRSSRLGSRKPAAVKPP